MSPADVDKTMAIVDRCIERALHYEAIGLPHVAGPRWAMADSLLAQLEQRTQARPLRPGRAIQTALDLRRSA